LDFDFLFRLGASTRCLYQWWWITFYFS